MSGRAETTQPAEPTGQLSIRTIAMPTSTNPHGDVFGGWLMSQMDLAAGQHAMHRARGRIVTVAVDRMAFLKKVSVGDDVSCFTSVEKIGRTSMTIRVEVWVRKRDQEQREKVTEGLFTMVAIDTDGRPRPVPQEHA